MNSINLTDHFLIAMPAMDDPYFSKSLIYIAEHNDQGALGIIVNRPIDMTLAALFERIEVPLEAQGFEAQPVYFGGPVQTDRGFVLHHPLGQWNSTVVVAEEVGLTSSKDILEAVARGEGPPKMLVALGYAGWGPGQLEDEISRNAWLTLPADAEVIFDTPVELRLSRAFGLLGIDPVFLSTSAGHA